MSESIGPETTEITETLQQALDSFTPELKEAAERDPGIHLALEWSHAGERPTIYRAFQVVREKYGEDFRIPRDTMSRLMTHGRAVPTVYEQWSGELEHSQQEAGLLAAMSAHERHSKFIDRAVIILKAAKDTASA